MWACGGIVMQGIVEMFSSILTIFSEAPNLQESSLKGCPMDFSVEKDDSS